MLRYIIDHLMIDAAYYIIKNIHETFTFHSHVSMRMTLKNTRTGLNQNSIFTLGIWFGLNELDVLLLLLMMILKGDMHFEGLTSNESNSMKLT